MAQSRARARSSARRRPASAVRIGLAAAQTAPSGGSIGSGFEVQGGIPQVDYLDELGWPEYVKEFRRLENDGMIAKALRSLTYPLLTADWSIEPASDEPRDVLIAELCSANLLLLEGGTYGREFWLRTSWLDRLGGALLMLLFGHALFHKTYRAAGRFTVFDDLKYLEPDSVWRWKFAPDDTLIHVERQYADATGITRPTEVVPAAQLQLRTWDRRGGNVLGRPIVRPAWRDFVEKDKLRKVQMIDAIKTKVGIPFYQSSENGGSDEQKKGEQLAKLMRGGNLEKIYAAVPHGADFGWKEGGQSAKGLPELIAQRDEQIAKSSMTQVTELGMGLEGGSRGVAGTHASFSERTLTAIARVVAEQEDALVRELVDLNFTGVRAYPKVHVSRIDPFEMTRSIPEFLEALSKARALGDIDLENEIRRRYGFMEIDPDSIAIVLPEPAGGNGAHSEGEEEPPTEPGGEPPPTGATRKRVNLVGLEPEERVAELERKSGADPEKMRLALERFELGYFGALRAVLRDMRAAVVERVRAGELDPKRPRDVPVEFQAELRQRLLSVLQEVRDFGRETVRREIEVQLSRRGARTELAANPGTRRGAVSFANRNSEVLVSVDVETLVARLQAQVTEELSRLSAAQPSPQEAARAVRALVEATSDRQIEDMARKSTSSAFNLGRNIAVQEIGAGLEPEAVRTEVLDENTCEPCQQLHGLRVAIGSPAYFENMPPAQCEGRQRCRGFYLVFPK